MEEIGRLILDLHSKMNKATEWTNAQREALPLRSRTLDVDPVRLSSFLTQREQFDALLQQFVAASSTTPSAEYRQSFVRVLADIELQVAERLKGTLQDYLRLGEESLRDSGVVIRRSRRGAEALGAVKNLSRNAALLRERYKRLSTQCEAASTIDQLSSVARECIDTTAEQNQIIRSAFNAIAKAEQLLIGSPSGFRQLVRLMVSSHFVFLGVIAYLVAPGIKFSEYGFGFVLVIVLALILSGWWLFEVAIVLKSFWSNSSSGRPTLKAV